MEPRRKSRFWRICRIYFRRFRIGVWLTILALVGALVYLNQVGLPGIIKRPLLDKLRERGIDLQFTRLRLQWYHGIVAENVRFGSATEPLSPRLTLAEVEVQLDHDAMRKFQLQVDSLVLRHGRLIWPIVDTNHPGRQLSVENIQTDLRFLPNDEWALDNFTASFLGAKLQLSGNITNASEVRNWRLFRAEQPVTPGAWQKRLRLLADKLEGIHFHDAPALNMQVRGDARDLPSFQVRLGVRAPGVSTPWGQFAGGNLKAWLTPAGSNGQSRAELDLKAEDAQTQWGAVTNLQLVLRGSSMEDQSGVVADADLHLIGRFVQTPWGGLTNVQFNAQWVHSLTRVLEVRGRAELECEDIQTRWGHAGKVTLEGRFSGPGPNGSVDGEARPAWQAALDPYRLDLDACVDELQAPQIVLRDLHCGVSWQSPQFWITNLQAHLYGGQLSADASLNLETRGLDFKMASDFDPQALGALLTDHARHWLGEYSWDTPPRVKAEGSLVVPALTNRHPDWRTEVQPTLCLNGEFELGRCAFRGVPADSVQSHFSYSNRIWRLPDMEMVRPEGRMTAEHSTDERTRDFYWHFRGMMDVNAVKPLLEPAAQYWLATFGFSQPPVIDAQMWGRWENHELLGVSGYLALTNFTFRNETISNAQTRVQYTNLFLLFTESHAQRIAAEEGFSDGIGIDCSRRKLYLTNCHGTADPQLVARLIGPFATEILEPYQFTRPPMGQVHGFVSLGDDDDVDLNFHLDGGPFQWWKIHTPHISGNVHWMGRRLYLNGLRAEFHDGSALGSAEFEFTPDHGANFNFEVGVTNARLESLVKDLVGATNNPEGFVSGRLLISRANSEDYKSWEGLAAARLEDGLIWDIPIFGVFSPVLNGIAPGLGSSRASAATGTFAITNGIIRSDDLEIRSSGMRLQYRGSVDLNAQVSARVEAELLRDMWLVGPIVSTVFWPVTKLFEYRVGGSLNQPKLEPVYLVPRIVLMPFHPIRSLREMFPEDSGPTVRTNTPLFLSPKSSFN